MNKHDEEEYREPGIAHNIIDENCGADEFTSTLVTKRNGESLIAGIAIRFIGISRDNLAEALKDTQSEVCEFYGFDVCTISLNNNVHMESTFVLNAARSTALINEPITSESLPWCETRMIAGEAVAVSKLDDLPADAAADKKAWRQHGFKSCLELPLLAKGKLIGRLSFYMVSHETIWQKETAEQLRTVADVLASAIALKESANLESEIDSHYRTMMDNPLSGVFVTDPEGTITFVNSKIEEIFGYSKIELVGDCVLRVIHPNDHELVKTNLNKKRGLKQLTSHYECRGIRKDGKTLYIEILSSAYIRNGLQAIFGNVLDITERKEEEEKNREEVERYRSLIDSSSVMIWSVDPNTFGLLSFNPAYQKYYREMRGVEVRLNMTPYDYIAEERQQAWIKMYMRAIKEGPFTDEYITSRDERVLSLSFHPMEVAGRILGVSVFGQDVTELSGVKRELMAEKEHYRALIESTNNMVWSVEPVNLGLTSFNSAFADYYKSTFNIDVKNGMTPRELLPEEKIATWYELYGSVLKNGKMKLDYRTRDGKYLVLSFSLIMVDDRIDGVSVFAHDLTTESEYRIAIEKNNESLQKKLLQSINAISKISSLRDAFTNNHQRKVQELSCAIAKEMGLPEETITDIYLGSLIHDIGQIYIPANILGKPEKLTDLEYQVVKTHALLGYEVASEIEFRPAVLSMILQHHERLDGSGYPNGITGESITLESRILAVADVVEAMAAHRPYRPSLGIDSALDEIKKFAGKKYDSEVVEACIKLFRKDGFRFTDADN